MRIEKAINIQSTIDLFDYYDSKYKNKPKSVIEFGCGYGRNLIEAIRRYKCSVVGLDTDKLAIEDLKKEFKEEIFEISDLSDYKNLLKYKDLEFDLGITYGLLMYIEQNYKNDIIIQMKRICKKLIIIEPESERFNIFYAKNIKDDAHKRNTDNYCDYGLINSGVKIRSAASKLSVFIKD